MNNPDESLNNPIGYQMSEQSTKKRLNIEQQSMPGAGFQNVREYYLAVRELFMNDIANWILLASCLRTQQSIAMGQFT